MQKPILLLLFLSVLTVTVCGTAFRLPLFHQTPVNPITSNYFSAEYNLAMDRASEFLGGDTATRSITVSNVNDVYQRSLEFSNACGLTVPPHIVIGTDASGSTENAGMVFRFTDLPMLSFGASADDLSNKFYYPSVGRTVPPTGLQGFLLPSIMNLFKFRTIVLIHTTDPFATGILNNFNLVKETYHINVALQLSYPSGTTNPAVFDSLAQQMLDSGVTRFFCLSVQGDFVPLVAAANTLGLTGSNYQWIGNSGNTGTLPAGSLSVTVYINKNSTEFLDFKSRYLTSTYNAGAVFDSHPIKALQGRVYDTTLLALRTIARKQVVRTTCANAQTGPSTYNPAILAVNTTEAAWCSFSDNKLTYTVSRNVTFIGAANPINLDANGDVQNPVFALILRKQVGPSVVSEEIGLIGMDGKVNFFAGKKPKNI